MLDSAPADVIFCDIHMPGLDGMELARVLGRFAEPPQIVFVTAYEDHALHAFEQHGVDRDDCPQRRDVDVGPRGARDHQGTAGGDGLARRVRRLTGQ